MSTTRFGLLVFPALAAAMLALGVSRPGATGGRGYDVLAGDLEPFRSAFNAASADVRAVLLVGPT